MVTHAFSALLALAMAAGAATAPAKLTIVQPGLHAGEDGPPVPSDYRFIPGETVYYSFQFSGYRKSEDQKIDLSYEIQTTDSKGLLIVPPETGAVATSVSAEDKDWMPRVRYSFNIPPFAESGEYKIEAKLKDNLAATEASATTIVRVDGHAVAPSDKLVIRNFRFLRGEQDKEPLQIAAYRPGDTIWARFDITGYSVGPGNSFDVEYGVTVLRSDGSVAYSQPHAAEEKRSSFYPQRYTPGVASLSVPPDLKKGPYTMVITATDAIGNQTAEARGSFTVE